MKIKNLFFPSLPFCGVMAPVLRQFAKSTPAKPANGRASYDAIDTYIEQKMRSLNIPGVSLAVVEGDRIVHLRGFGKARPGGEAPTPQTPFFIGSLTKSFTAMAIMQLVEAGKVELDEPVQRYLPWFRVADPQASAQITVRHLLNQTSGIPMNVGLENLGDFDNRPDALERRVRDMSIVKLKYPVGSKFEYNNANYNILGLIAEAASGEPYSRYVQNHIFNPLEMSHSFTSKADSQQHGLAVGYRYWFGQPIPAPNLEVPLNALPSGQLICSAEDIAHYLIAQLNGGCYGNTRILSEAGIDEMHRGAAEIKEMGLSLGSYAMGWIEEKIGRSRIISHSGIVPDFGGFMAIVPEQKKGIVLLYNANHAMMKMTFDEFGLHAAQLLAGEKPAADKLGAAPWLMRSMLLIPIPQIALFATSLRQLNHWRANSKASLRRRRKQHALLPLALNLLPAVTLVPLMGKMRGFIELFMPDYAWLSRICGGFAMLWSFLRTGWILRSWRKG